ncbi:MAG: tRNA 2-thiocytidine biosynthesis TtcA family protein [Ruminococcus sp.]|jgi:tRNA(Ile)-lysidine synthase TilS/MesJ|nr:tRNA 2-thiocytidine biosynthesis TtcA family protein [Ruminococcus sp.]
MQKILGYMRRAITEYDLLSDGDKIAVGVSGGKDSLVLLRGLFLLKRFIGFEYELIALTADMRFGGQPGNFEAVAEFCREMSIPYNIIPTDIAEIVFDIRKEKNPCSLCAKMRRGILHEAAKSAGCNKIALGHSFDDAVETFVMNLFMEGRLGCFSPKSYLSRRDLTLIRPLVFAPEKEIKRAAYKNNLPIVKSSCPEDGHTNREEIKKFLAERERFDKGFTERLFGAMRKADIDRWAGKTYDKTADEQVY